MLFVFLSSGRIVGEKNVNLFVYLRDCSGLQYCVSHVYISVEIKNKEKKKLRRA